MPDWLQRLFGGGGVAEPAWLEIEALRQRLDSGEMPLIVDVRGTDEFVGSLGHIDGARNIPLPDLTTHIPEIRRKGAPVVLVCLTDKRSSQAAAELTAAGIRDVTVLRGGMRAWRET